VNDLTTLIPLATGVVISPLPIVAVVAILLSARGRANGTAYATGTVAAAFVFTIVAALTTTSADSGGSHGGRIVVLLITAVLAVGFAVLAVLSWLTRPRDGAEPRMPGWLAAVDTLTPLKAAGLGLLMAVTNGKNIPLELKAGAVIGALDLSVPAVLALSALFAVAGSLGVIVPTVLAAIGSARIDRALQRLKAELITHNAVIMTVLFAILAAMETAHLVSALVR